MGEIRVRFGDLGFAQGDVAATARRMSSQLDELKRFIAPMVASWQGQAAEEYGVKQRQWDSAAADLTAVLGQIGVALGTAQESYQQVETANAARWR
jgi:early secretory antigenic target protein ESAT-6